MFTKLILIAALLVSATACGGSESSPVDLQGVWQSVEKADSPTRMSAIISSSDIEIVIIDEEDGAEMLYWLGTVPENVSPGDTFVSEADVEALSVSLFGSMEEEKEFTFDGQTVSFEQGMMGVTWRVTMRKVK